MAQINQQLTPSANITTPPSGFMAQFFNQSGELSFKDENGNVIIPSAQISSSFATTASYAVTSSYSLMALTASYAVSASFEINYETSSSYADFAKTASFVATAVSASNVNSATVFSNLLNLNFENDAEAAAAGIPLGGLYRNGNVVAIRFI
jgi:hypothetical protein